MNTTSRYRLVLSAAVVLAAAGLAHAQFTTPNVINVPGSVNASLGTTTFTNHGLVGVGRISASAIDSFGETFGSVSGLQITNWTGSAQNGYSGTFNILPDRGYNNNNAGGFFSNYAARVQTVNFAFTPYQGMANIGGTNLSSRIAAQNQISMTSPITGQRFTYADPATGQQVFTTGLDPAASSRTLFGATVPFVTNYTGQPVPGQPNQTFSNINRLTLDSEALALRPDGSGFIGDEYGANIYYFNSSKQIVGVITPPAAMQPHGPVGTLNFQSTATPLNGRRNNQGFEGVSLSPDGTRLIAVLQSATRQDSDSANNQNARHTRVLSYDVSGTDLPITPIAEYALTLPTYRLNGSGGAVDRTCAQSEIVALDNDRFLMLARDGNGLGASASNPSMYKSVLLVDMALGNPTNLANNAAVNAEGGRITSASGVLSAGITPLQSVEVLNMLNSAQLSRFNINLDTGIDPVTKLTLGEKWEGMSLVSANDPANPFDYFLFVANDNDFLTSDGRMVGPDGSIVSYNAFTSYPGGRVPGAVGDALNPINSENDTMFLAYRVTIIPAPGAAALVALGALAATRRRRTPGN